MAKCSTSRQRGLQIKDFVLKNKKGKRKTKPPRIQRRNPEAKMAFPVDSLPGAQRGSQGASSLLQGQAFLHPECGCGAAPQRAPVDAPQPQQVEEDGQ